LAPKREVKGPKSEPTKASVSSLSSRKKVTRANPDPKPTPAISNLEKLLRKSKDTLGQSSSSKGKSSSEEITSAPKKSIIVSTEKLVPIIEEQPIISKTVEEKVKPENISLEEHVAHQLGEHIVEEWNPFSYLIKDETDEELNFLGRPIKDLPKYSKEEIEQI
jgi:hypothetical protein